MRRDSDTYQDHTSIELHHGKLLIQLNTSLPKVADNATPGEKLWYYRELRGLTREEFGRLVGLEPGGVQNFEAGINQIHYRHALKFADLLDVEPEIFLSDYTRFCAPGYGDRIRKIRYACDQTQEEFAEMLGVTRSRVSVWEAEIDEFHPSFQSFEKLVAIASENGVQTKRLIEDPDSYSDGYDEFISGDYGKKIKYIRAAYGVTQTEFCRMLGVGDTSPCMWELENRKPLRKHFGRIKFLAEAKGISLARFASEIGVSSTTVNAWESTSPDKCSRRPGRESFRKICDLLCEAGGSLDEIETDYDRFFSLMKEYRSPGYGRRIRKIREKMGLKRKKFAAIIGVGDQTVDHWEKEALSRGRYICPGELTFYRIWQLALKRGVDINDT